ncbi:sulfatase/phosphatase domain-containing protein [Labilibaculum sp.]|uniref:sulfatase/phosphatase domain-containing protein n=1 Tax=Labilibaculum sp. TaxID=2060723 RepID=UPI00356A762B
MYLSWLAKAGNDKTANDLVQRYRKRLEFQLFDLNNDPEEMNNLANNPEFNTKINELKSAIQKWMKEQGDDYVSL